MAYISQRGAYWRAEVRKRGHKPIYRTFDTRQLAREWAQRIEAEISIGIFVDRTEAERHLQRRVDRLRAGVREEDPVEGLRHEIRNSGRCFERKLVPHLERRRVVHGSELSGDGLDDFRTTVTCVDAPQASRCIQHATVIVRYVVHALRGPEHARRALELPVRRERHPEVRQSGVADRCAHREIPPEIGSRLHSECHRRGFNVFRQGCRFNVA
nr:hypothetical protein [Paraburkholderia kururiensis]